MSVRLVLCLILCAGDSAVNQEGVTQIAPGADISWSCSSSGEFHWEDPQFSNTVRMKFNSIEYLLIKNAQLQNQRRYTCSTRTINLELKSASSNDESVLFRVSEGDSVSLFCKDLTSSPLKATWSWRSHHSGHFVTLRQNCPHFGNRLRLQDKENDFSLSISPVDWSDSGRYECKRLRGSSEVRTVFEVRVVRVRVDPQTLTEGGHATLHCEVSHWNPHTQLYWINMETQENFPNPLQLEKVKISQRNWACAVLNSSSLRALIPLTLNISQPLSTTAGPSSPTPHSHTSDESTTLSQTTRNSTDVGWTAPGATRFPENLTGTILTSACTGFFFILIVVLGTLYWRTWTRRTSEEQCPACATDSVTYAEMSFRQRSEQRNAEEAECSTCERDSVAYAEVSFRRRSGDDFPARELISKAAPDESEEVLYSSVNFSQNVH